MDFGLGRTLLEKKGHLFGKNLDVR